MVYVKLANIRKEYKISKVQSQEVLKGVNVEFKRKELVAILGESGCGKSTLINIMGGIDLDYTGSIELQGDFIRDYTETQMDDYRKKKVGLIFQNYNLIPHMTLLENVEIAMTMTNALHTERKQRALELLQLVGMDEYHNKLPNQLSGGQKQRVAIARALANNPAIILADEPTGALDKDSADAVLRILKRIADKGKLVIIVTHSQKIASECSRIIEIDDGVIIKDQKNPNYKAERESEKITEKEIKAQNISIREIFKLAFRNLWQTKSRSILVSLGMSIGITAVILILCLSTGLTRYVNVMLKEQNSSALVLMVEKTRGGVFNNSELEYIQAFDGVAEIYETNMLYDQLYYSVDSESTTSRLNRLYTAYEVCTPEMLYGTLPVTGTIIINSTMASSLTEDDISTLVGTSIRIRYQSVDYTFTVSGIYSDPTEKTDTVKAFISISDMNSILETNSQNGSTFLYITVSDAGYISALKDDLAAVGYSVTQVDVSATELLSYIDIATGVLTGVSAISMIVSAIMIFIVLYISVIERTNEIGIIRAIGGKKSDIRKIFVTEAFLLGTAGGVISCILALIIAVITNIITAATLGSALISYAVWYYFIGLFSCIFISGLSGLAPSIYAANMDPVEALRAE